MNMEAFDSLPMPCEEDVAAFLDQVDETTRLVDGLRAGTISVDYVDTKIKDKTSKSEKKAAEASKAAPSAAQQRSDEEQQRLLRKVAELQANRERKLRIRQQYEEYVRANPTTTGTDYNKWGLWCPDDEEDDLFNNLTPNTPEFRAMERDINERHQRMVERRQLAERQRVKGNEAFKAGQYSEALRCYQLGLDSARHDMALNCNAALAALKLKCFAQAEEHCSKVLHLAEVLHNRPADPLCIKALQRRAAAHQGLNHVELAVKDLQRALDLQPGDAEITKQLAEASAILADQARKQQLEKLLADGDASGATSGPEEELKLVARLCKQLAADVARNEGELVTNAQAISQLAGLVTGSTDCKACFRLEGGLQATAALVVKDVPLQQQLLQLLCKAASAHSSSLAAIANNKALLQHLCQQLGGGSSGSSSTSATVVAASVDLLQLLAADETGRQQLCGVLGEGELQLLDSCVKSLGQHTPDVQAATVTVLANCALSQQLRAAVAAVVHKSSKQCSSPGDSCFVPRLLQLLQETVGISNSSSTAAGNPPGKEALRSAGLALAGNLCSNPQLRQWLAGCPLLVAAVLQASTTGASASSALGCLCNLLTCPAAQAAAADSGAQLVRLLQLSLAASAPLDSSSSSRRGPLLPDTSQKRSAAGQQQQQQQGVPAALELDPLAVGRAALAVSRIATIPAARSILYKVCAVQHVLAALDQYLQQQQQQAWAHSVGKGSSNTHNTSQAPSSSSSSSRQHDSQEPRRAVLAAAGQHTWLDSMVRLLAALLGDPAGHPSSSDPQLQQQQLQAMSKTLVQVLRLLVNSTTSSGNAALCLSHLAGVAGWARLVQREGAVQLLVDVMVAHKGQPACRNAAISLAKLGKEEQDVLLQLRELRAFEMMVQYVKP